MQLPGRIDAIHGELEKAVHEYIQRKDEFDRSRVGFETACERFGAVKRLAMQMLNSAEWYRWQNQHQLVKFAATPIGEAITSLLSSHAFDSAIQCSSAIESPFAPSMHIMEISGALEAGGFKFNTTSPLREVNAALMRLKGIQQIRQGQYQIDNAQAIFNEIMELFGKPEEGQAALPLMQMKTDESTSTEEPS